ncbi:OprO/OprP family phosphate-selective porin [Marinobacter manganoxydans]|nr:porin [Marinobacter manganoxydans]
MMNKNKSNQFLDRRSLLAISGAVVMGMGSQAAIAQTYSDRVAALEKEVEALKAENEKSGVIGSFKGGRLGFASKDGDFTFALGGRLFLDTAWADTDDDSRDLGQETFVRAARFAAKGKIYQDWRYKLQYEFVGNGAGGFRDAYLQYHGFKPGGNNLVLSIGNQFMAYGLENMQSAKYIAMMERSAPMVALGQGSRRLGVRADVYGDGWNWAGSIGQRVPGTASPQDDDDPLGLFTKVWFNPVLEKGRMVHLGASLRREELRGNNQGVRLRVRPENQVDGFRTLDTGVMGDSDGFDGANLEAAFTYGSLNLNAEYYWQKYDELENAGANTREEPEFTGGAVTGIYYLTGESRPYTPKMGGTYGAVTPNNPLRGGGIGAWAVSARFSTVDLTDSGIDGGRQDVASIGLNWYPEKRLRFSVNAGWASVDGGPNDGSDPTFLQARTQLEW